MYKYILFVLLGMFGSVVCAADVFVAAPQSTAHDYLDNTDITLTYSQPGATGIRIHFSQFATEADYDFVYILDQVGNVYATYHGDLGDFESVMVPGDSVYIRFVSDGGVVGYGFDILGYSYTTEDVAPSPPSDFLGAVSGNDVVLSWVNPFETDFESLSVRRSTKGYPETVLDGDAVLIESVFTQYTDQNLGYVDYYYSIFSQDLAGNISVKNTLKVSTIPFVSEPHSTPHVYLNNTDQTWVYSSAGAKALRVSFANFSTHSENDYVVLLDKNDTEYARYYGVLGSFDSVFVLGDTVKVRFVSDASLRTYGFDLLGYGYVLAAPTHFTAIASGNSTVLQWENPDPEFDSVTIRRGMDAYPEGVDDGEDVLTQG